jgi:uncharacterized protein DUF4157
VPPIIHEVLRSPGQPLDATMRTFMEPRFGHDFSQVRLHHTDAKGAESARAVNALAYTVGHDIVFWAGQYAPRTIAGRELMWLPDSPSTKRLPGFWWLVWAPKYLPH